MDNSTSETLTFRQVAVPQLGGWIFVILFTGFLFFRPYLLLGDGDSCRHFLNGMYMLEHHQIPTVNYFSALFPNEPWINRCLLGDLAFGSSYALFGLNGLIVLSAAAIAVGLTWTYQFGRARGLGAITGPLLMIPVVAASSLHWTSRCHVFSYLAFLSLYYVVFMSALSNKARLLWISVIMIIWTNLHGSFVIGLLLLGVNVIGNLVEAKLSAGSPKAVPGRFKFDMLCFLCGALATLVNSSGWNLHKHLISYVSRPVLFMFDEFRSVDIMLGMPIWCVFVLFGVLAVLCLLTKCKRHDSEILLALTLFIGGMNSMRIIPYFAIIALPTLGPLWRQLKSTASEAETTSLLQKLVLLLQKLDKRYEGPESHFPNLFPWIVGLSIIEALVFFYVPTFKVKDFAPDRMPVQAANFIQEKHLDGLGYEKDNWGGYLYWRLGKPIFLDDWPEFYPPHLVQEYLQLLSAQGDWQGLLEKYHFQYVLLEPGTPLGILLSRSPDWQQSYKNENSELYVRKMR